MNLEARVTPEDQPVRLLQVGVVVEQVFEARAEQQCQDLSYCRLKLFQAFLHFGMSKRFTDLQPTVSAPEREGIGEEVIDLLTDAKADRQTTDSGSKQ